MAWNYVLPTISSLPVGYDCTVPIPVDAIARRINATSCTVVAHFYIYHEGRIVHEGEQRIDFRGDKRPTHAPAPLVWRDVGDAWKKRNGFLELSFHDADEREIFANKAAIGFYTIYTAPGKKSFFSDNAYKYGAPPVISQIAMFGRFVDGYPVVHLDRDRDLAESITLINPYKRPVLAKILTQDGRTSGNIKIPPLSVRSAALIELLRPDERSWFGQIQLTASNRLVTYNVKHSLHDPALISDHEHLDPFRADPTHLPAFQAFRQRIGKYIEIRRS
ncbi:MAG: hypothetical protein NTY59_00465 [Alphaproteobacteria bacterium]|nr:hypothetical protein [Alphaproteobacteria bacterium]